jgi:hypothetical protein
MEENSDTINICLIHDLSNIVSSIKKNCQAFGIDVRLFASADKLIQELRKSKKLKRGADLDVPRTIKKYLRTAPVHHKDAINMLALKEKKLPSEVSSEEAVLQLTKYPKLQVNLNTKQTQNENLLYAKGKFPDAKRKFAVRKMII